MMKLLYKKALDFFETFALCVSLETTLLRLANDDDEALKSQQVRTLLLLFILLSPLSIPLFCW